MDGDRASVTQRAECGATGLMRLMLAGHLCRCEGEPKWREGPSTVTRTGQIKSRRTPEWV